MRRDSEGHDVRLVADSGDVLGESPVWDPRTSQVAWIDAAEQSAINTLDWGTHATTRHILPTRCTAIGLTSRPGEYVAALGDAVGIIGGDGSVRSRVPLPLPSADYATNDGGCDAAGFFWLGTSTRSRQPLAGSLWRFDGTAVEPFGGGYTLSNGLAWNPDGTAFYHADSLEYVVRRNLWDDAGQRRDESDFVSLTESDGLPDGIALDEEGGLWIAFWGPGEVRRYDSDGNLDRTLHLSVPNVTAVAFGGPDLSTLLITTAQSSDDDGLTAGAGSLYAIEVGVAGAEPLYFNGNRPA